MYFWLLVCHKNLSSSILDIFGSIFWWHYWFNLWVDSKQAVGWRIHLFLYLPSEFLNSRLPMYQEMKLKMIYIYFINEKRLPKISNHNICKKGPAIHLLTVLSITCTMLNRIHLQVLQMFHQNIFWTNSNRCSDWYWIFWRHCVGIKVVSYLSCFGHC